MKFKVRMVSKGPYVVIDVEADVVVVSTELLLRFKRRIEGSTRGHEDMFETVHCFHPNSWVSYEVVKESACDSRS